MRCRFVQRGGWWVVGQFILLIAVAVLGIVFRHEPGRKLFLVCSLFFLLAATICGLAGLVNLGRNLTPFPRPSAQTRLVRKGIYGLIRHPLYSAVMCAAFGWSLFWQSGPAFVASLALAIFFDAKARNEEQWLQRQLPDYVDYMRCVRNRFIPWLY